VFQAADWSESEWQMLTAASKEENDLVTEAYDDPDLQPVVTMTRLSEAQYVTVLLLPYDNSGKFENDKKPNCRCDGQPYWLSVTLRSFKVNDF